PDPIPGVAARRLAQMVAVVVVHDIAAVVGRQRRTAAPGGVARTVVGVAVIGLRGWAIVPTVVVVVAVVAAAIPVPVAAVVMPVIAAATVVPIVAATVAAMFPAVSAPAVVVAIPALFVLAPTAAA